MAREEAGSVEQRLADYRRRRRLDSSCAPTAERPDDAPGRGTPPAAGAQLGSWLRRLVPAWERGAAQSGDGDSLRGGRAPRSGDGEADGGVDGGGDGSGSPARKVPWLRLSLWLLLLGLFFHLQLLTPFLLVSVLVFLPLASSRRARGTPSAYSVFNPGCRPLPGAITTEQLEREMGYRAM